MYKQLKLYLLLNYIYLFANIRDKIDTTLYLWSVGK